MCPGPGANLSVVVGAFGSQTASSFNGALVANAGKNAQNAAGEYDGQGGQGGSGGTCFNGGRGGYRYEGGGAAGYAGNGGDAQLGGAGGGGDGGPGGCVGLEGQGASGGVGGDGSVAASDVPKAGGGGSTTRVIKLAAAAACASFGARAAAIRRAPAINEHPRCFMLPVQLRCRSHRSWTWDDVPLSVRMIRARNTTTWPNTAHATSTVGRKTKGKYTTQRFTWAGSLPKA